MSYVTSSDIFDAMLYGVQDEKKIASFKEATARVAAYIPQHFQSVHAKVVSHVDRLSSVNYRNAMKIATAHIQSAWTGDYIRPLHTVEDIQAASPIMQRYVMAEPTYRSLFNQGQANGYGSEYIDAQPGACGDNHDDYRRVQHGRWIENDEEEDVMVLYDTVISNEDESEELTFSQQLAISDVWFKVQEEAAKRRHDVGCQLGGSL